MFKTSKSGTNTPNKWTLRACTLGYEDPLRGGILKYEAVGKNVPHTSSLKQNRDHISSRV